MVEIELARVKRRLPGIFGASGLKVGVDLSPKMSSSLVISCSEQGLEKSRGSSRSSDFAMDCNEPDRTPVLALLLYVLRTRACGATWEVHAVTVGCEVSFSNSSRSKESSMLLKR